MTSNAKTVIIADDHETSVMYLSILMRRMGYTTIPVRNGEKLLQMLETVRPDLIITDIKMPVMDGFTFLRTMKQDQRLADIPVIMMTAYFEQDIFDQCMQLGGAGFLSKPIKVNELHDYLQECVIYPNNTRRRNLRFFYGRKVTVEQEGLQQEYYAVTLSKQGIYLRTQNPLPIGATVKIHMDISAGRRLTAQGTVIYQKHVFDDMDKLDPGMALKFENLSDRHANELDTYIVEMLSGDLLEEQQESIIAGEKQSHSLQERLAELKQEWQTN